jgi:gamma-glutamyl hercynylcysteine S-oxide synthase
VHATTTTVDREDTAAQLAAVRERTLALVASLPDDVLEAQLDPIMSPLVWDLAHIAAYEDLWLAHRHGGRPLLHPELAATYDAFETPRAVRGDIDLLDAPGARRYLQEVRAHTLDVLAERGADPVIFPMVLRHEQQHTETMIQCLLLAGPPLDVARAATPAAPGGHTGLEFVAVPGGTVAIGAPAGPFSFDNERPRHAREVAPFRLARTLVTNATWLSFVEGGGYQRREWWSDEAWAWKEQYDITHPLHWSRTPGGEWAERTLHGSRPLDPDRPAAHVSWHEATALASAHGARLPTEAEWETAAAWSGPAPRPALAGGPDATLDTHPVAADGDGPLHDLAGNLWEWTSTEFDGYPGFAAHPYREYSEVFFRQGYRVLRGGAWGTQHEVATPTFRNWDLPVRRQILSGVRLARDEEDA